MNLAFRSEFGNKFSNPLTADSRADTLDVDQTETGRLLTDGP
jgi:hypothetical protein